LKSQDEFRYQISLIHIILKRPLRSYSASYPENNNQATADILEADRLDRDVGEVWLENPVSSLLETGASSSETTRHHMRNNKRRGRLKGEKEECL
jgi:hypothetical protein